MAKARWIRFLVNDEPTFADWSDRVDKKLPKGAVEVDRKPKEGEDYTAEKGWHFPNVKDLADYGLSAHIKEAHSIKYLEAVLVGSGYELTKGLLVKEAQEKNMSVKYLADLVLGKAAEFELIELTRQRNQSNGN